MPHGPSSAYIVEGFFRVPSVNTRTGPLWRPDNRFPGEWMVRRHEEGGIEISFTALRHGAKPRKPIVVPKDQVDRFIYSCLEVAHPDLFDEGEP